MCWVKWEEVTKPRSEGGLGVRDLRRVNASLLAKWRWRLLSNEGWFSKALRKKVGNGRTTSFWKDVWIGTQALKDRFPRLFSISVSKDLLVAEVGGTEGNRWCWSPLWRRNLFEWEVDMSRDLHQVLQQAFMSEVEDRWIWSEEDDGIFLVKSCYNLLSRLHTPQTGMSTLHQFVFQNIWKSSGTVVLFGTVSPGGTFALSHCGFCPCVFDELSLCFAASPLLGCGGGELGLAALFLCH
ncbi:putative non-LTR retroelement reverse transcriptase [Trifolium medium]|uniref:Putative non-LTR retroelement reverse transcriptase n=1 Tax=Trifolium medium TaxID=97028 RepID=A0A392M0P8_9FABA|nr:putative non-LTR retroelement reverse transcriptase [Trifolium medium]